MNSSDATLGRSPRTISLQAVGPLSIPEACELVFELRECMRELNTAQLITARQDKAFQRFLRIATHRFARNA